jgi:hypothetical protein
VFTEQTRLEALSVGDSPLRRDARALVEATIRDVLTARPELRAVCWVQSVDDPDPDVFIVSKVVVEFTSGATFDLDTATYDGVGTLDSAAFAVIADLVLAQSDILVEAFGLDVNVVASREGAEVTRRSS